MQHPALSLKTLVQQITILAVILIIALWTRLHYVQSPGFVPDLRSFATWMQVIQENGILHFYEPEFRSDNTDRTYPPLGTASFAVLAGVYGTLENPRMEVQRPAFVSLLKIPQIAAEIVLIVVVYFWLRSRPFAQRVISTALALHPALIVVSAWWGQVDALYVVFLALALIALTLERPLWAWVWFAIAMLFKQPALFFAPLILVITFRRWGWRKTIAGIGLCGGLIILALIPFVITSGVEHGISSYVQLGDTFPYITNNAYNTWYVIGSGLTGGEQVTFMNPLLADAQSAFAGISYKLIGLIAFGVYVLFLMAVMWRQAREHREFIWAAALYFGFFMLPTQVHERYLYPTALFIVIAVAQDRRLWWVALGVGITFTYNIMAVLNERLIRDLLLSPADVGVSFAALNMVLFAALIAYQLVRNKVAQAELC